MFIGSVTKVWRGKRKRKRKRKKASNFKPQASAVCLLYSTFQLSPESFLFLSLLSLFFSTRPLVMHILHISSLMAYVNNKDTWEILMAFSPGKSIIMVIVLLQFTL